MMTMINKLRYLLTNEFNKVVNGDDVLIVDLMTGLRTEKYIKEFKKNKKNFELIE